MPAVPPMEVFQFEDQLEAGVNAYLRSKGVNDVSKQRDYKIEFKGEDGNTQIATLKTPRVEPSFISAGCGRKHYHAASGLPDLWDGTLYLKIVTRRDGSEPTHKTLRSLCRYVMLFVSDISALMKFHKIEEMFEIQSSKSFDADKLHDVSALSFQTCLRIRPEFLPTS